MDFANVAGKVDMKRKWNWPIWVGFVIAVGGLFSYEWFAQFPVTCDFPWANLLLFGIGAAFLVVGLFRAFGRPQRYRGKVFGSVFSAIAFLLFAFFGYEIFYLLRQVPASSGAPRVDNWHRTSYYWIKVEIPLVSAICSGDSRDRRRSR